MTIRKPSFLTNRETILGSMMLLGTSTNPIDVHPAPIGFFQNATITSETVVVLIQLHAIIVSVAAICFW